MKANALLTTIILMSSPALANNSYSELASEQISTEVEANFSQGQLAQMLAPIALYPDTLLTHILIAASYPLEIVDAYRWREENKSLSNKKFSRLLEAQDWDESVKALVPFERVLKQMHDDIRWMQNLGDAFLAQEEDVLITIQELRQEANNSGSLDDMDNADIVYEQEKIIIVPRSPEVIYVPYYDTRVVYGPWRWRHHPPVYWHIGPHYHHRSIAWHAGVHIDIGFFFNAIHWHHSYVVINHHKPRYYRKRHHILSSGYSKRWAHKPHHRRKVVYRSASVHKKYHTTPYKHKVTIHKEHYKSGEKRTVSVKHSRRELARDSKQSKHVVIKNKLSAQHKNVVKGREVNSKGKKVNHLNKMKEHNTSPHPSSRNIKQYHAKQSAYDKKPVKKFSHNKMKEQKRYKSKEAKSYKVASSANKSGNSRRSKERH